MLSLALAVMLSPTPTPAVVVPSCETRLEDILDARTTLEGLLASERLLIRRHARSRSRSARLEIEALLGPISNQARALELALERQERAYIRCVEAQLDARPRPATR